MPAELLRAGIAEDRVLILVNDASEASHFVATKYREYHPNIPAQNVVYLSGLPDIETTADEIITRADFETNIAQPVRQHLLDNDLVDHIWVIVTTAGMPYRIEDTTYADVVKPHAGNASLVENNKGSIDAASVETELAVLWQIDPALDPNHRAPIASRIVNPYHGYISPMEEFCGDRDILARRSGFNFQKAPGDATEVVYEGQQFSLYRVIGGRQFCVKDMYLVARIDGPRYVGISPSLFVSRMLELSARVSNPNHPRFHGYDPSWSVVVIDDKASGSISDNNHWQNAGSAISPWTPPAEYLTASSHPTPPNVTSSGAYRDDYRYAFRSLSGQEELPDPEAGEYLGSLMSEETLFGVVLYDPTDCLPNQGIDPNYGIIGLCSFGIHQSGVPATYLLEGGPQGDFLFRPVYGAVFNSTESWNAVTFFADAPILPQAAQGLVWQWLFIGGSGGLGNAFEPLASSIPDNDLLFCNYLQDADGDGVGDMTFVEAAYSSVPYLSWATVIVGDPLMRVHRNWDVGPGWWEPGSCGGGGVPIPTMIVTFLLTWVVIPRAYRCGGARSRTHTIRKLDRPGPY